MGRKKMARFDVTTVGESNLRLSVPAGERIAHAASLELNLAGTEANVVCAVAQLGHQCGWISALPNSPLGERAINGYSFSGLDMSAVKWVDDARMATLFVEYAVQPRPTQVFYDRKNSAFAQMTHHDIDWDYLLDTRLIHLTGITAALSESCEMMTFKIIKRAKEAEIPLSFDVNHRTKLWSTEKAQTVLHKILPDIDLLFCSKRDAITLFNAQGETREIIERLAGRFGTQHIVMSDGASGLYGWANGVVTHEPAVPVTIIDRIGAGDAMAAGVLHGWLNGDFLSGLRYGALAASCIMSQKGDVLLMNRSEFERLDANRDVKLSR
ncbi:MAG: sugar kinase [Chloroflexota bacterium]